MNTAIAFLLFCFSLPSLHGASFSEVQKTVNTHRTDINKANTLLKNSLKEIDEKTSPLRKKRKDLQDSLKKTKAQAQEISTQKALLEDRVAQLKKALDDLAASDKKSVEEAQKTEAQITNIATESRILLTKKQAEFQAMLTKLEDALSQMRTMYLSSDEQASMKKIDTETRSVVDNSKNTLSLIEKKLLDLVAAPTA
jgi:DNA repair exonuclease SbcCD ATPase subunit